MKDSEESNKQPQEKIPHSTDYIKTFYTQIQKMPQLTKQARVVDQILLSTLQDLKANASNVVTQLGEQKKEILQRFDNWIMPIAQDVLDALLQDAEKLKNKLAENIDHIDEITSEEWDEQAKNWKELYAKWHDRNALIEKILDVVAHRTTQLIDKDIQVIKEYQTQSLAHLPEESETFRNVEERLKHAIEEPLKQLMTLRNKPQEHTSLQQASEWVAALQEKRESYFDQLLMKIDHVIKDVVHLDDRKDWSSFLEVESEILFMESELHHINADLAHIDLADESEKQFILGRLEGLLDHLEQLQEHSLPPVLKQRIDALKTAIDFAFSCIK